MFHVSITPFLHPARRWLLALLFMGLAVPALALEPFQADYRASYMGLSSTATMSLVDEGGRWSYRLELSGAGARLIQSTTFAVDGQAWRPLHSEDSQRGESGMGALLVKNRSVNSSWDWERLEARWSGDTRPGREGPVAIQAGDLDAMLLNLALVRDVAARRPLNYRLVENGRAREQRFRRAGTEQISVNGETHRALKVIRSDGNRELIAWIVTGLPVPARIVQRRNGKDEVDLQLLALR